MDGERLHKIGAWSGGTVVDLAVCGDTVLAATFAGIYTSTDAGHTWRLSGKNLPDWFVQAVALVPAGERIIGLAASHLGWLYRSPDDGAHWEVAAYWSDMGTITRLVTSPNVATDGIVFACTEQDGLYKSTDRGRSWKSANFGLLNLSVSALCFSPDFGQDEIVFAGTDGGGLFRSRNAGRAWRESGEGLPDSAVQSIAISPHFAGDGVVLAGTEDAGLYCSTDGGQTWTSLGEDLSESCVNALYVDQDWTGGGHIVVAADGGLLYSADEGRTWQPADAGPAYPYAIVGRSGALIVGAYEDGVYLSQDGAKWQVANEGLSAHLPPLTCFSEAFEQDGTVLMTSMEGALVRSTDAGQTWSPLADKELSVSAMASAGAGQSMSLLAADEGTLLCSRDSGATWQAVRSTGADPLTTVAFAAGSDDGREMLAATAAGQVFVAHGKNLPWQRVAQLGEMVVALAGVRSADGLLLYTVTAQPQNDGTWLLHLRRGSDGQNLISQESSEPVAVLHPLAEERLLCSLGREIWVLEGEDVARKSSLEGDATVSCLATSGETLLAGSRFGLFCSEDDGLSWRWITAEMPVVALYATRNGQVIVAEMGGRLWQVDLRNR